MSTSGSTHFLLHKTHSPEVDTLITSFLIRRPRSFLFEESILSTTSFLKYLCCRVSRLASLVATSFSICEWHRERDGLSCSWLLLCPEDFGGLLPEGRVTDRADSMALERLSQAHHCLPHPTMLSRGAGDEATSEDILWLLEVPSQALLLLHSCPSPGSASLHEKVLYLPMKK